MSSTSVGTSSGSNKKLRRAVLLTIMLGTLSRLLIGRGNQTGYEQYITKYLRAMGYSKWSQLPSGDYTIPVDKYTGIKLTVNQSGDESTPDNCQLTITRSEILYFGGFIGGLDA